MAVCHPNSLDAAINDHSIDPSLCGIALFTVPEGVQFPHTHCHFLGHWNTSNVHVDLLLAPYQQYWQLDHLVACICCETNSDACHTVASLEAAYGSIQQPVDNPVAVQTCRSRSYLAWGYRFITFGRLNS